MVGVIVLLILNVADALLLRTATQLGAIELNPIAPPLEANPVARGLIALVIILVLYFFKKSSLRWWLVALTLGFIVFHAVGYYMTSVNVNPS